MADEKNCSKCGKKLRSDNTKGICGQAGACAKRAAAGGGGDDAVLSRIETTTWATKAKTPPKTKSDDLKRFRVVAEAMGHDPEELLATYCRGWLAAVKQAVDTIEAPAHE